MNSLENQTLARIGKILLLLQNLEFLIQGCVSFVDKSKISKFKKFKHLTPEVMVSIKPEDKSKRRQTLGELFEVLKRDIDLGEFEGLDNFLQDRNTFIHHLSRECINSKASVNLDDFLTRIENDLEKWDKIFKGFLNLIGKYLYAHQKNIPSHQKEMFDQRIKHYEKYEALFFS